MMMLRRASRWLIVLWFVAVPFAVTLSSGTAFASSGAAPVRDNGSGISPIGPLCDGDFSQILNQLPSASDIRSAVPYAGAGACWSISAFRPYGPGLALGNFMDDFIFQHLAGVNPCIVGAARAAGPVDGGIVESVSTDVATIDAGDGYTRQIAPLSQFCPSVSLTDLSPNLINLYLSQTFSHAANQTLEITVAPVHAYALGVTDGIDYSEYGQFMVTLSGTGDEYIFSAYNASGTIEIPLKTDQTQDQLRITGEGIAVTHVAVVSSPAATATAVPSSTNTPAATVTPGGPATATPTPGVPPASVNCGYLQDCNFVAGPAVAAGACGTTYAGCADYYTGSGGPWQGAQCFNDSNMGIAETSVLTRTWGAWQCRRIGQVVSIPSAQPGDTVHISFYGRAPAGLGTAGTGDGPLFGDLGFNYGNCGVTAPVGAPSAGLPALSADWQLYSANCPVGGSGWSEALYIGSGGSGTSTGFYEVMSPTVELWPGGVQPSTPTPMPAATYPPVGGTPGCTPGPSCETAVAATETPWAATQTAVAGGIATGTPPVPLATVQAYDCFNFAECTGVLVTPGPPVTLGGTWDGGADTSPCTAVSWPVWRSPPADLFPSSLNDVLIVGGVVDAAAWLVGGGWSIVRQTIVPQHTTCDLSPVYNAVKAKATLPDTTPLVAVFHVPPPTCGWFGVRGLVVVGKTFDLGFDGCSAPWVTVLPEARGLLVILLWMGFSLSVARGIERRVRVMHEAE